MGGGVGPLAPSMELALRLWWEGTVGPLSRRCHLRADHRDDRSERAGGEREDDDEAGPVSGAVGSGEVTVSAA
jgi:hypothetical protein